MSNDKKIALFLLFVIAVCVVLVSRKYLLTSDTIQVQAVLLPLPQQEQKHVTIPGFAGQLENGKGAEKQG